MTLLIILCVVALTLARPQPQQNFVLWNYFPFLQQQMMQQANIQMMHPVNMPQYPTFEMFFSRPHPMANNMPIIGEVQFQVPMPVTQPPKTTQKPSTTTTTTTTRRPRPTTTTSTSTTSTTTPVPPPSPSRPTKRRVTLKPSLSTVQTVKSQLSKGIFEMARNIQTHILSEDNDQQTSKFSVFSPINVAAVLSLLALGANGQTNQELQHTLGFDKLQPSERPHDHHYALGQMFESVLHRRAATADQGAQINMANGIFMQTGYSLCPDYRTSLETIYQSQVSALDFKHTPTVATNFINDWVRQQTNGKIENILAEGVDRSTRMMVASAVHFKASWESSFIMAATSKRPFYPNGKDGQKILVDTMGNGGEFMYYSSKDYDCSIMALPFKGHTSAMYIILPNKSNGEKLRRLQSSLTSEIVDDMISKMQMRTALITLPKMHLSDNHNLKDVLSRLNLRRVFESGSSDLSGMVEHNQISLDGFMHKVDLTVNEVGTEAAAASATQLSRQDFEVEFRVDTPFMFIVRHEETKLPIFYGSVIEPVNES